LNTAQRCAGQHFLMPRGSRPVVDANLVPPVPVNNLYFSSPSRPSLRSKLFFSPRPSRQFVDGPRPARISPRILLLMIIFLISSLFYIIYLLITIEYLLQEKIQIIFKSKSKVLRPSTSKKVNFRQNFRNWDKSMET
jgi:hypothetical protein